MLLNIPYDSNIARDLRIYFYYHFKYVLELKT